MSGLGELETVRRLTLLTRPAILAIILSPPTGEDALEAFDAHKVAYLLT
jgi:hypothetical protein